MEVRLGATLPLPGIPLAGHRDVLRELRAYGYASAWAGETDRFDAVSILAAAVTAVPELEIGTAVLPAGTRGPAVLAMTAAALAELAPGRVALGVGSSSPLVVRDWNRGDAGRPLERVRSTIEFLRTVLAGERVGGFRLAQPPAIPPALLVGALGPAMVELAAAVADGVILTCLSPDDARHVVDRYRARGGARVAASVPVCPVADASAVRDAIRPMLATYLDIPAYADFHRSMGRDGLLGAMWDAWAAGDRAAAVAALPDKVVDDLVVHGSPDACRARIAEYAHAGVTDLVVRLEPALGDPLASLRAIAP
ncbi:MAG TPA: LLM class F420-dependent oxidoreductase [Acidimicrobiia bacterium]|nr:LLM class F420-dependent oxidoreductase [Acidimicrobiia bacterium]